MTTEPDGWGGKGLFWWEILLAFGVAVAWVSLVRPGPLSLPYFWDEADVYAQGSWWLAQNGLDIRPGVFPDDYSRGHPQLLYFVAGLAFRLFGPAPAVGHLVVLPFTVLALVGTYLLGTLIFGRPAGVAAAVLLAVTPMFLSVGNMLLPEAPLCALSVWTLVFFARGRMIPMLITGSALVLIKETGVFTTLAVSGALLWDSVRCRRLWMGRDWIRLGLSFLPVAVLGLFFVWQRLSAGYFIFPHHQDMFFDRPMAPGNLLTVWPSLVIWHGRRILVAVAMVFFGWLAITRNLKSDRTEEMFALWRPQPSTVVVAFLLLVLAYGVFFSKMFWLDRYGLPAHPGVLIALCGFVLGRIHARPLARWWWLPRVVPVAAAAVLGFTGLWGTTAPDEEELTFAYADVVRTHQAALASIEQRGGDPLVLTSWPMTVELRHPYLGYVTRKHRSVHIDHLEEGKPEGIDLVLLATRSRHAESLRAQAQAMKLRPAGTFQAGAAQALELWSK